MHTVQPGETLSEIAKSYGVPLDVLGRLNGIDNANTIVSGQTLRIPAPAVTESATPEATEETLEQPADEATEQATETATPETTGTPAPEEIGAGGVLTHTVQPGESASEIAKQYGVALDELMARNGILNANRLYIGMVLDIPGPDAEATTTPTVEATEEPTGEATEEAIEEATEEATAEVTEAEVTAEATEEATEEATGEATEEPRSSKRRRCPTVRRRR
jgi:LysM repeat protein